MSDSDDLPGDDPEAEKFVEDFERHRDAIYDCILDYMDEEDLGEAYVAQLLIDAMIRMRMTAYGLGVESPSVAGLKMDLDRLKDEVERVSARGEEGGGGIHRARQGDAGAGRSGRPTKMRRRRRRRRGGRGRGRRREAEMISARCARRGGEVSPVDSICLVSVGDHIRGRGETVDARDLKSLGSNPVWVQVPPSAPRLSSFFSVRPQTRIAEGRY